MAIGGKPDEDHPDPKINAALALTKTFVGNHHAITDEDFHALKALFTEKEITNLENK